MENDKKFIFKNPSNKGSTRCTRRFKFLALANTVSQIDSVLDKNMGIYLTSTFILGG